VLRIERGAAFGRLGKPFTAKAPSLGMRLLSDLAHLGIGIAQRITQEYIVASRAALSTVFSVSFMLWGNKQGDAGTFWAAPKGQRCSHK
jgi:hypothetical protein